MAEITRVGVCDDSALIRAGVRAALASVPGVALVGEFADGASCLAAARDGEFDVVLMDVEMPGLGGVETTRRLVELRPEVRVVALTADDAAETVVAMIEAGASSYVLKGARTADLVRAVTGEGGETFLDQRLALNLFDAVVRLFQEERRAAVEFEALTRGVVRALAGAIEARDGCTGSHVERVGQLASRLAAVVDERLVDDPQTEFGFLLHDLGKLGVPDAVLRKPGSLDRDELVVMRTHVEIGARLLEPIPGFARAREIVLCHHERWDGGGYPRGLRGEEIPLGARLFTLCDAFDAMTSDRPYRSALAVDVAVVEIARNAGLQFDPDAAALFVDLISRGELEIGAEVSEVV